MFLATSSVPVPAHSKSANQFLSPQKGQKEDIFDTHATARPSVRHVFLSMVVPGKHCYFLRLQIRIEVLDMHGPVS